MTIYDRPRDYDGVKADVVVVLVSWRTPELTAECVLKTLSNEPAISWFVVVVNEADEDSATRHRAALHLEGDPSQVVYQLKDDWGQGFDRSVRFDVIDVQENQGFAGGCNIAIDYLVRQEGWSDVLFLNNDASLLPGSLDSLLGSVSSGAVAGCSVIGENDQRFFSGQCWPWVLFNVPIPNFIRRRFTFQTDGSSTLMSKATVLNVVRSRGYLYDRSYFLYLEDAELALWLKSHGIRSVLPRGAFVRHRVGGSLGSPNSILPQCYQLRNRIILARTYLNPWTYAFFKIYITLSRRALFYVRRRTGRLTKEQVSRLNRAISDGFDDLSGRFPDHDQLAGF